MYSAPSNSPEEGRLNEMKNLLFIALALATMGAISGCAGDTDPFIYGSEVMLPEEIEIYREFLLASEGPELADGIAAQKEMVDTRAADLGIMLAKRRNRGSIASRLGQSGSPMGNEVRGTGNAISATPQ